MGCLPDAGWVGVCGSAAGAGRRGHSLVHQDPQPVRQRLEPPRYLVATALQLWPWLARLTDHVNAMCSTAVVPACGTRPGIHASCERRCCHGDSWWTHTATDRFCLPSRAICTQSARACGRHGSWCQHPSGHHGCVWHRSCGSWHGGRRALGWHPLWFRAPTTPFVGQIQPKAQASASTACEHC